MSETGSHQPLDQLREYLNDPTGWKKLNDTYYYKKSPEFKVEHGGIINENFDEEWVNEGHFADNKHNQLISYKLIYLVTCLDDCSIVALGGYRYYVPLPKNRANPTISKSDISYKVAELIMSLTKGYDDSVESILLRCKVKVTP